MWRKLTAGLPGIAAAAPSAGALSQAQRVGTGTCRLVTTLPVTCQILRTAIDLTATIAATSWPACCPR